MLFHITYQFGPAARNTAQQRFKETGGMPGEGVTMIGRWHMAAGLKGYLIAESANAVAIGKWMQDWTDILTFEVTPVVDDEGVTEIIG